MTCRDSQRAIAGLTQDRLPAELADHLARCAECASLLADDLHLRQVLQAQVHQPSTEVLRRLRTELTTSNAPVWAQTLQRRKIMKLTFLAAAVVVTALFARPQNLLRLLGKDPRPRPIEIISAIRSQGRDFTAPRAFDQMRAAVLTAAAPEEAKRQTPTSQFWTLVGDRLVQPFPVNLSGFFVQIQLSLSRDHYASIAFTDDALNTLRLTPKVPRPPRSRLLVTLDQKTHLPQKIVEQLLQKDTWTTLQSANVTFPNRAGNRTE